MLYWFEIRYSLLHNLYNYGTDNLDILKLQYNICPVSTCQMQSVTDIMCCVSLGKATVSASYLHGCRFGDGFCPVLTFHVTFIYVCSCVVPDVYQYIHYMYHQSYKYMYTVHYYDAAYELSTVKLAVKPASRQTIIQKVTILFDYTISLYEWQQLCLAQQWSTACSRNVYFYARAFYILLREWKRWAHYIEHILLPPRRCRHYWAASS